ncbi:MAG: DNA polymerase I [Deltaproteobacteria bacterium]
MPEQKLFLIDATALCYRAFYAIQGLSTSLGQPTNAIYGFINILNKLIRKQKPAYLAVCFDVSKKTFRSEKFAQYKMNRKPMPDGLSGQIPVIKDVVRAYGLKIFEKEGYEADDVIACLAEKASKKGMASVVISADKDLLQLVSKDVSVLNPQKTAKEGETVYDEAKVCERFGIEPKQIPDYIALVGDAVDNIPGIKGVTEKRAVELVREYGSVEKLIGQAADLKPEKLRAAVIANAEQIRLNKELARLSTDVDLEFVPDELKVGAPDSVKLFTLFKELEFKNLLKDLEVPEEKEDIRVEELSDEDLKGFLCHGDELALYGTGTEDMLFSAKGKFFKVPAIDKNLRSALADPSIKKTGHDLKKLRFALARQGIPLEGLGFDVKIAAYLLNPSKGDYGLAEIAWERTGKFYKAESLDAKTGLALITRIKPPLEAELREKELYPLFVDTEMPLVGVLSDMEIEGIKLDLKLLENLSQELTKRLDQLVSQIHSMAGEEFNINSPMQLREVLFERLKLPVYKRTKTGPSTDEEVLNKLADKHEIVALLLEYRQLSKLKNTYIDALPALVDQVDGKVHTSFNQTGTETGRLSSSNPNLQNIPVKTDLGRSIRASVIPFDKKSVILACDYSQIELRILAHMSQDATLLDAFEHDKDIHRITAALVNGVEEKDVTPQMRDMAKAVNFGIVYGSTSFGLSKGLGISIEKAQQFIDAYFARYPGVQEWIREEIEAAERQGYVTTILGRRRYLPEICSSNINIRQLAQRQAMNTPIQGSASDLIKCAMIQVQEQMKKKGFKGRMLLQIHDELLFTVPKDELDDLAAMVKDRMENVLKLKVPVKVDVCVGPDWCNLKDI